MRRELKASWAALLLGVAVLIGCSSHALAPATSQYYAQTRIVLPQSIEGFPICQQQDGTQGQCGGVVNSTYTPNPNPSLPASQVPGYHPSDVQNAYGLMHASQTQGSGETIAIVTAFRDPYIQSDLKIFRKTFGLPACSTGNGCLTIVTPPGQRPMPNANWGIETALDTEMVSAICPLCKILVVESKDDHFKNLALGVDTAFTSHANVISNSYAGPESKQNDSYAGHYSHRGVAIVAGAGDGGYSTTAMFPASSPHVTTVGGTTLTYSNGNWTQTVWSGTSSGCSAYMSKPSWQHDTGCTMRTSNDVAVVGDPATGVAIWSTYAGGWIVVGGTSVGTPLVASMYALAGNMQGMQDASGLYANAEDFTAITGSNGTCNPTYLCTAGPGYNGPAGLGVPYGLSAF